MARPFEKLSPKVKNPPRPFQVQIPQLRIDEMISLLKLSKLAPETYENSLESRQYGVTRKWMIEAKNQWESFDWSLPSLKELLFESVTDVGKRVKII
jgi:microsomal epoxide hydrolase